MDRAGTTNLGTIAELTPLGGGPMGWVRERTEAILVVDQVRSTDWMVEVGDRMALRGARRLALLLREIAARHGGQINNFTGDGAVLRFGDADDAVAAARSALLRCSSIRPAGAPVALRAGLHVGVVLHGDDQSFGLALVTAVRLCDQAGPGELLLSGVAADRYRGRNQLTALGGRKLKGIPGPVEVVATGF